MSLQEKILNLKREKNALIIAHFYQEKEIQEIADLTGDSYELSRIAATSSAEIIVFCGVHFMAETANILAPQKTVLLPEITAGCPLANTISAEEVREMRIKYPQAAIVCYINSSAAVKAECDICCTSSNAVKVVNSLPHRQIVFLPDGNLAHYVSLHTDKEIIPWRGSCSVHNCITREDVEDMRKNHPDAPVLVHPECKPEVVAEADFVGGTAAMIKYVKTSPKRKFIIGTEEGMLHPLSKNSPDKKFFLLSKKLYCPDMKKIKLTHVYRTLKNLEYQVEVPSNLAAKAFRAVNKMLEVS